MSRNPNELLHHSQTIKTRYSIYVKTKNSIREWLVTHFSFIPKEDYCFVQHLLGSVALKACKLQKEVERLERKVKRQEKLIHGRKR